MELKDDPRWHRLNEHAWTCPRCGGEHQGLFDLVARHPDQWRHGEAYEPNSALRMDGDFLSEDFCILRGEHFFVRSLLYLPITGADQSFGFGVWGTLSRRNFELYVDSFDDGTQARLGPWFSWFSNGLRGYPDTMNLKSQLHPRDGRQRPVALRPRYPRRARADLSCRDHPRSRIGSAISPSISTQPM